MARINIEDGIYARKEFKRLVRALGDEDRALGMLYRFWRDAQDYWGDEKSLMPKPEFLKDGFEAILESGLAEERPNGIYALGSEERFAWYLQKCRANRARWSEKYGQSKKEASVNAETDSADTQDDLEGVSNIPLVPSPSLVTYKLSDREKSWERLLEIWNQNCDPLPTASCWNKKRKAAAKLRWGEVPDPDYWIGIIRSMASSRFCNGDGARGDWKATFDFLLRPDTHTRVTEGDLGCRRAPGKLGGI